MVYIETKSSTYVTMVTNYLLNNLTMLNLKTKTIEIF
jgi:hypothetical protein